MAIALPFPLIMDKGINRAPSIFSREASRLNDCQTIYSFSASLLAIFVTGGPLGANKRFLAVLSKCWQSVVWILLTRIWYRKRAWKSPNGLAKEALLRCGCSLFGFQVWLFRKLKRPDKKHRKRTWKTDIFVTLRTNMRAKSLQQSVIKRWA